MICNSQSRIHQKLRQRLLKIRFDPPNREDNKSIDISTAITRGDLRQTMRKKDIDQRIWKYIHCHPSQIHGIINDNNIDFHSIVTEILLLTDLLSIMDNEIINKINIIYPLINDSTFLQSEIESQIINLIRLFKQKFEANISCK